MTATAEPRTRRWRPEELAIVNGYECCYTIADRKATIRLPGGTAGTVGELRARGAIVIPPARPRLEDGEIVGTD